MTWLRYAGDNYQPDVNIRLEDVVGVTVGRISGLIWGVTVFYSDGQEMPVGTFSPVDDQAHESTEGLDLARARAEEIKALVDNAKGSGLMFVYDPKNPEHPKVIELLRQTQGTIGKAK